MDISEEYELKTLKTAIENTPEFTASIESLLCTFPDIPLQTALSLALMPKPVTTENEDGSFTHTF